ncbi:beta-glucuronidase [Alteromonas pelagimontana]|uniref:Beta-glucuronidase n=2 Tax=Alteromonas pelagimontana TaxID=1858656 RepID=A0A6M4MHS0_9ALTE|nr:beta-glucuronidase [Alteromonas pelagimontana]
MFWLFTTSASYGANQPDASTAMPDNPFIQNPYGREVFSLNGQWTFIVDPYENGYYNHRYQPHEKEGYFQNKKARAPSDLVEYNFDTAKKISVPGDWNTQYDDLFFYEGTVWYNKNFHYDKKENRTYVLHFGAVNYHAIVYVNGRKVGVHEGGFTSFQFDISHYLKNGDNFVTMKVDNRRERDQVPTVNTDWWNYGGITRSVAILSLPKHYLADYRFSVGKDNSVIRGSLKLNAEAANNETVAVAIPALQLSKEVAIGPDGSADFEFSASPVLWTPENPTLYDVVISYKDEEVKDRIGFRTIAVEGEDIKLNGKPIFLRGISIHEESPLTQGRAWSKEDARLLLSWAKELGCNFVRLAHYPHNEAMLRMADEMGLMVWSEIPVYWTVLFDDATVYQKAERQLQEMISRDKNRASIIMWSVANETPNTSERLTFLTKLVNQARAIDNSRLITAAMDTQSSSTQGKVIDDPLADVVDVIGINSYCGWYSDTAESCAELTWQSNYHKPIIMSELGAGALQGKHGGIHERWTEEFQENVYIHNLEMVKNISALRGLTPWILKDFRSPRRPLNDIQDFWNRKGLVSEKGIRKKAWYVLRDFYQEKQTSD